MLKLPPCHTAVTRVSDANQTVLQNMQMYSDMAKYYKAENRRLRVRASENIEAVRQFWRNNILEERTRAGKMVMLALR